MAQQKIRYRIGIDVGLYSDGLTAIEIDDSSDDPRDAMPIRILSSMSVIHDGGVDPQNAKVADSRKAVSGVARRTRRRMKQQRKRLSQLDVILKKLGYPVDRARDMSDGTIPENTYWMWNARIFAATSYIKNDDERALAITAAVRHIARHRGWRNPYEKESSLIEDSKKPSEFYLEFYKRIAKWEYERQQQGIQDANTYGATFSYDDKNNLVITPPSWGEGDRPTPAELVKDLLVPQTGFRIRRDPPKESEKGNKSSNVADIPETQMKKLHQSDNCYELLKIFKMQKVPENQWDEIITAVFKQVNPKEVGAAAKLVAKDDLPPGKPRASRASIAFQKYVILTTITNLRLVDGKEERRFTAKEIQTAYKFLCSRKVSKNGGCTWSDLAETLGTERNNIRGTGGVTKDGEPISNKVPPYLSTEKEVQKVKQLADWWYDDTPTKEIEREIFIEMMGNAGLDVSHLTKEEQEAKRSVDSFLDELGKMDEAVLNKVDNIHLKSGRAAYSVDTLTRLNRRMLHDGMDLFEARKAEFGVDDNWRPQPNKLGTPTGNPAVDRNIKIVARWICACNKKWGKPETVNIELVRQGFMTPKKAREEDQAYTRESNKRYEANQKVRQQVAKIKSKYKERQSALSEEADANIHGDDAISHGDIRRLQAVQRQNGQCIYCGKPITFQTCQMDHIVPRKGVGSSNDLPNLVAACASCNKDKSNQLFYTWAKTDEKRKEVIERVDHWNMDSYFTSENEFNKFKKDVKARLLQKEEDDPLDNRSIESVAWTARELREQIEGYFGYRGTTTGHTEGNEDYSLQRVSVFRGSVTAAGRRASGLENSLPWIGDKSKKTRLDRRHHAVDAAVIAMMRDSVALVLAERDNLHRNLLDGAVSEQKYLLQKLKIKDWTDYCGDERHRGLFVHWRDEQMKYLISLLSNAMKDGKVIVTNPLRLRLGLGRAHEDTIKPLYKCKVGDKLTPTNIDKAETPQLWCALTRHPDFDPKEGLPEDWNRRIRVNDKWLDADDEIGFMADSQEDFNSVKDAVYEKVNGGYAAIGNAIHHARFYRYPKISKAGKQTGWKYGYVRVFQTDLLKHQSEDLFHVDLPQQSISVRSAIPDLRRALFEGTAEYLGWAVVGDEIDIVRSDPYYGPTRTSAINLFLKAFPTIQKFKVIGLKSNEQIKLAPMEMASEGAYSINDLKKLDEKNNYG